MNLDNLLSTINNLSDDTQILISIPFDTDPNTPLDETALTVKQFKAMFMPQKTVITNYNVIPGGVNIRQGTSTNTPKIGVLDGGANINTEQESNGFVKLQAWVSKQFVTVPPAPPSPLWDLMYVRGDSINVRASASTNSTLKGTIPFNEPVYVMGNIKTLDGHVWGQIMRCDRFTQYVGCYLARDLLSPTKIVVPVPPVPVISKSKAGLHIYAGAGPEVLQFIKRLADQGRPLAGVTLLKPNTISVADIKRVSPLTKVTVRHYIGTDGDVNPADWQSATKATGASYFVNRVLPIISSDADCRLADRIQPIINEPGYHSLGTPRFYQGMLDAAQGKAALSILGFGVGYPPLPSDGSDFWTNSEMIALAERVANEIPVAGKKHAFGVHQYTNPTVRAPRAWNDPYTIMRHQQIMKIHQAYRDVTWSFLEFGDEKMPEYGPTYFIQQVSLADELMKNDVNVESFNIWTAIALGYQGNWATDNINVFLPDLEKYLTS